MALNTFTPPVNPTNGTTITPELAIDRASFGDGYAQASPRGLNHLRRSLALKWDVLTAAQAKQIETFLVGQGGYIPFLYRHPVDNVLRRWTCETWTVNLGAPAKVTATFREDFSLGS